MFVYSYICGTNYTANNSGVNFSKKSIPFHLMLVFMKFICQNGNFIFNWIHLSNVATMRLMLSMYLMLTCLLQLYIQCFIYNLLIFHVTDIVQ